MELRADTRYLVYALQSFEIDTHLCLDFDVLRPLLDDAARSLVELRRRRGAVLDQNRVGMTLFVDASTVVLLDQNALDMGLYTREEDGKPPAVDLLTGQAYTGGFAPIMLRGQDLLETLLEYDEGYPWPYEYTVRININVTEDGNDVYVTPEINTMLPRGELGFSVHTGYAKWNALVAKIPTHARSNSSGLASAQP
jgi:hypothetical protein